MFAKILTKLIKQKCLGTYNVSFGNKVYLDKLLNWLNYYNTKNPNIITFKKRNAFDNLDCFYLNKTRKYNRFILNNINAFFDKIQLPKKRILR